jgi:pyrrolysine biosynthesis protein PylC
VRSDQLEIAGEHIMSGAEALHVIPDFFGANEAITNYAAGRDEWVATLIVVAETIKAAWERRDSVIADLKKQFNLN